MAGPFTQRASGAQMEQDIGAAAVADAVALGDPNAITSTPMQTTRPAMQDPMDTSSTGLGGGPSASYRATIKAPGFSGRPTQEDFMGNPRAISVDGHVFSRPSFNLPASAIAMRLDEVALKEQQLAKAGQQLANAGKTPQVAAPYARTYENMVGTAQRDYIQSIAAQYGGDESAAWKAVLGQDPENLQAKFGWDRLGADMNRLGEVINHDFGEAERYIQAANSGQEIYDQGLMDSARNLMQGMNQLGPGGYGDVQALTGHTQNYRRNVALPKYLKESGIDQHVKDFMGKNYRDVKMNRKGGFTVFSHEDVASAEQMVDRIAEEEYGRFDEIYPTLESFKTKMHSLYPIQVELKETIKANPQPKGGGKKGGSSEADTSRGYTTDWTTLPPGYAASSGKANEQNTHATLNLLDFTGKKGVTPVTRAMVNKNGDEVFMIPTRILKVGDKYFVTGKQGAAPRAQVEGAGGSSSDSPLDAPAPEMSEQVFRTLPDIMVPYDKNSGRIEGMFGVNQDEVIKRLSNLQRPGKTGSQQPAAITPEEFDKQWAKLKSGEGLVGPDGQKYYKK